jgi:hypothetical protein
MNRLLALTSFVKKDRRSNTSASTYTQQAAYLKKIG